MLRKLDANKGLIPIYVNPRDSVLPGEDYQFRSSFITKNMFWFDEYWCKKVELFVKVVLQDSLDIKEYFYRLEFQR